MKLLFQILAIYLLVNASGNAAFVSGGATGDLRVKRPHNTTKILTTELNSRAIKLRLKAKLSLASLSLRGPAIRLQEEEIDFQITVELPKLDTESTNAILLLLIDYIALRRAGITRMEAEQAVFGRHK